MNETRFLDRLGCTGYRCSHDPLDDSCEEYDPTRAYFADDMAEFGGEIYVCVAPPGKACRYSPAEKPRWWEMLEG